MTLRSGLARLERQIGKAGGNGHGRAVQQEAISAALNAVLAWAVGEAQAGDADALALAELLHQPGVPLAWDSAELQGAVRAELRTPETLLGDLYHALAGGGPDGAGPEEAMVRSTVTPMGKLWRAGHIYGEHKWPEGEHPGWRACWNEARAAHPLLGARA